MSEVPVADPAAPSPPQPPASPSMLAGKFGGTDALEKGIRDIARHPQLNLPAFADGVPLIGDGRIFPDTNAAVAWYTNMEKIASRSGKPADPPAAPKPAAPAPAPAQPGEQAFSAPTETLPENANSLQLAAAAGLDLNEIEKSLIEKGDLTDEQYAKFKAFGPTAQLPKEVIHTMALAAFQGKADANTRLRNYATELTGGQAQLNTVLKWAATLPDREAVFKKINDWSNPDAAEVALHKLVRGYEAKNGKPVPSGPPSGGVPTPSKPVGAYANRSEFEQLQKAARAGDKAAQETINKMGPAANAALLRSLI
jgi:hypothetical protein